MKECCKMEVITPLAKPLKIHQWNKRIFLLPPFSRISWKLNPGFSAVGGSEWSEVGCAPGDVSAGVMGVSGVRECHVKNTVLGVAVKGLGASDRRAIWREIVWVNNLTDSYGWVPRGPSPDTSPKWCLLSHSDWLQWNRLLLLFLFLFSFFLCYRKFRSQVK